MASEAEIAWAAGLFEGEGSISIARRFRDGRTVYMRLNVTSTDKDVLERFAVVVGCGKAVGRHRGGPHKPIWDWEANRVEDTGRVISLLRPWLGQRRLARLAEIEAEVAESRPKSRPCAQCGEMFTPLRWHKRQKFCRDQCRSRALTIRQAKARLDAA